MAGYEQHSIRSCAPSCPGEPQAWRRPGQAPGGGRGGEPRRGIAVAAGAVRRGRRRPVDLRLAGRRLGQRAAAGGGAVGRGPEEVRAGGQLPVHAEHRGGRPGADRRGPRPPGEGHGRRAGGRGAGPADGLRGRPGGGQERGPRRPRARPERSSAAFRDWYFVPHKLPKSFIRASFGGARDAICGHWRPTFLRKKGNQGSVTVSKVAEQPPGQAEL
mmetsp:Transcript_25097/g.43860  ORF Transcript_25097/g.43860 Transcript_25097/m.43860 type:complete len:216 (-) Transcript_25097:496-1143(-)